MSFFDSTLSFIEGVKSMVDFSGAIQGTLSDILAKGIEGAFERTKKSIEETVLKLSLIIVSCVLIIWGTGSFIDNFMPYKGIGFLIMGVLSGLAVLFFFKERK